MARGCNGPDANLTNSVTVSKETHKYTESNERNHPLTWGGGDRSGTVGVFWVLPKRSIPKPDPHV